MRLQPEEAIMVAVFDYVRLIKMDRYIWHIANERKTSPQYGLKLKRMGVKSGVSDIFAAIPKESFHGLFIEVKTKEGRLTDSQKKFINDMQEMGYYAVACYGIEDVLDTLNWYLKLPNFSQS